MGCSWGCCGTPFRSLKASLSSRDDIRASPRCFNSPFLVEVYVVADLSDILRKGLLLAPQTSFYLDQLPFPGIFLIWSLAQGHSYFENILPFRQIAPSISSKFCLKTEHFLFALSSFLHIHICSCAVKRSRLVLVTSHLQTSLARSVHSLSMVFMFQLTQVVISPTVLPVCKPHLFPSPHLQLQFLPFLQAFMTIS